MIYSFYQSFSDLLFISGGIQYYSFKPIAIGKELLVFYGDDYFADLGYSLETDKDPGMLMFCMFS